MKTVTKEQIEKAKLKMPKHDEYDYHEYRVILFEDFTEPIELSFIKTKDGWEFKCVCC